jgi:hypothetical protein
MANSVTRIVIKLWKQNFQLYLALGLFTGLKVQQKYAQQNNTFQANQQLTFTAALSTHRVVDCFTMLAQLRCHIWDEILHCGVLLCAQEKPIATHRLFCSHLFHSFQKSNLYSASKSAGITSKKQRMMAKTSAQSQGKPFAPTLTQQAIGVRTSQQFFATSASRVFGSLAVSLHHFLFESEVRKQRV